MSGAEERAYSSANNFKGIKRILTKTFRTGDWDSIGFVSPYEICNNLKPCVVQAMERKHHGCCRTKFNFPGLLSHIAAGIIFCLCWLWVSCLTPVSASDTAPAMKVFVNDGSCTVDVSGCPYDKEPLLVIECNGYRAYYPIDHDGQYVIPFQYGEGEYLIMLCVPKGETLYEVLCSCTAWAQISDPDLPFLQPNVFINSCKYSQLCSYAKKICQGKQEEAAFETICKWVDQMFVYDYIKALDTDVRDLPDIDGCLQSHMGICQDLSGLACCMLRCVNIPAKLVVGYVENSCHAWVEAELDGKWIVYDPTQRECFSKEDTRDWKILRWY